MTQAIWVMPKRLGQINSATMLQTCRKQCLNIASGSSSKLGIGLATNTRHNKKYPVVNCTLAVSGASKQMMYDAGAVW
jgi:hypothetical protein